MFAESGETVAVAFAADADFPLTMTAVELRDVEGGGSAGFVRGEAVADVFDAVVVADTEDGFARFAQVAVGAGVINAGAEVVASSPAGRRVRVSPVRRMLPSAVAGWL